MTATSPNFESCNNFACQNNAECYNAYDQNSAPQGFYQNQYTCVCNSGFGGQNCLTNLGEMWIIMVMTKRPNEKRVRSESWGQLSCWSHSVVPHHHFVFWSSNVTVSFLVQLNKSVLLFMAWINQNSRYLKLAFLFVA